MSAPIGHTIDQNSQLSIGMDRIELDGVIVCRFHAAGSGIELEFPAEKFTGSKSGLATFFAQLGEFITNQIELMGGSAATGN